MSSGVPTVVSKTQALVEISKDSAVYANPLSVKVIAKKISEVMKNHTLRTRLVKKGLKTAQEYSWSKSAKGVIGVYQGVVGK
jgi:glycosyltransferase involved in cell wall biosynthesis